MNNQSNSIEDKFKIIISVGDESGIGPEIICFFNIHKKLLNLFFSI